MKAVKICWLDSRQPNPSWQYIEDIKGQSVECQTMGFIVHEDDKIIMIAQNLGDDGEQASGVITIPKACITNREEI